MATSDWMDGAIPLEGGCRCGAVRYRLAEPPERVSVCHCRDCQRASGAPAVAWMLIRKEALSVDGDPKQFNSTGDVSREFCGDCGTGLFYRSEAIFPGKVDVQLATLDVPEAVRPSEQVQTEERLSWMELLDSLPSHLRYPPA